MSDTFTRDRDAAKFRTLYSTHDGEYCLEPIPTPPQTEAEILAELDRQIDAIPIEHEFLTVTRQKIARAIVAACGKIAEVRK